MGLDCTIYSVAEADLPAAPDVDPSDRLAYYEAQGEIQVKLAQNPMLDLGKMWDALHFSLGNREGDHPLAFLELGGEALLAIEEARYFPPEAVARIAEAVAAVPDETLVANFARHTEVDNPDELYPSGFAIIEDYEVTFHAGRLRAFLAEVVAASRGVIVHIAA